MVERRPPLGADRARLMGQRGIAALGTSVAVGGLAATVGYVLYARREQRPIPKDFPLRVIQDPEGAAAFGAWRWGLLGLGFTAIMSSIFVFVVAA